MLPLRVARPAQCGHVTLSLAELPRFLNDLALGMKCRADHRPPTIG
jgi:hypothetical protein